MNKPVQARTLKTRAKLINAAQAVVATSGYEGLRVEEVVKRAGVAKGTFFAHFRDKDALMDQLLGAEMDRILDALAGARSARRPARGADVLPNGRVACARIPDFCRRTARFVGDAIFAANALRCARTVQVQVSFLLS